MVPEKVPVRTTYSSSFRAMPWPVLRPSPPNAYVLIAQERYDEAEAVALSRLASSARGRGAYDQAVQHHREAIARFDAYFEAPNLFAAFERAALAKSLTARGRYPDAETALLESLDLLGAIYAPEHEQVQQARQRLADLYEQWGRPEEDARWRTRQDE